MDQLERWVHRISRILAWSAGAIFLVSAVLVTLDVLSRLFLRRVYFESFELSTYGFAIAVALGLAFTVTDRANVRIDLINARLPAALRAGLDVLAISVLTLFALMLAWYAVQVVLTSVDMGARSNSSLAIPLVFPQGLWAAGMVWFALVCLFVTLRAAQAALRQNWPAVEAVAGLPSDRLDGESIDHRGPGE